MPPEALEAPLETGIEKAPQFRRSAKLRDGIKIFESRCERIGQAPDRSRLELGILRREVQVVHLPRQAPRDLKLAFDEGLVDDHLGRDRAQLRLAPRFYLLPHGLEVPLPVHTDRDGVYKRKALRVF